MKGFRKRHKDAIHDACVRALEGAGRQVYELDGAKRDEPGIPDVLVAWGGGVALLEFKSGSKAPLEDSQIKFHREWRGPRGTCVVVRSVDEALAATGVLVSRGRVPGPPKAA